jgi:hypothetical protein
MNLTILGFATYPVKGRRLTILISKLNLMLFLVKI